MKSLDRVRAAARSALVLAALAQAWVFRHSVNPDGISYLDLSDAVVTGRFGDIVNGYWSPLYPTLIGLVRAILPTPLDSPYWEFAVVHVVNVIGFILALGAFERFLGALDESGIAWGQRPFATPIGLASAYALFGVAALSMISAEGSIPDLLLCAALFAAFACILRLRLRGRAASVRTAVALGVALALGALAKSFVFPLALVVLITLGIVNWRHDRGRASLIAGAVFAIACGPWVFALSRSLGHFSTGETGALNYAWYVNHKQPPNTGVMPALVRPRAPLPLDGVGILAPAPARGTNPLWLEPAHWHRDIRPTFSIGQQWVRIRPNLLYYVGILAPVLFSVLVVGFGAEWRDLRTTLARGAVVLVPSLAAFGAYAMVYATSRYVAPFLAASLLTLGAAFPAEARLRAGRMALSAGLALLAIDVLSPMRGRVFLTYALAAFLASWLVWRAARGPRFRWLLMFVTTAALLALVSQLPRVVVLSATVAVGIGLRIMLSRVGDEPDVIASELAVRRTFAIASVVALMIPSALASWHAAARWRESAAGVVHPDWATAQRLRNEGIAAGSPIAVVGSPEASGWARLNRYRIVAVVPERLSADYAMLSAEDRAILWRAFAAAGATSIVTRSAVAGNGQ